MVCLLSRDDLLFSRLADRVVVIPDEPDLRVVAVGTGIAVEHTRRIERRHVDELLRKQYTWLMALAGE